MASFVEASPTYTGGHLRRVSRCAHLLAQDMGLCPDEVDQIELSGFLHDLGKFGVPDAILRKAGCLNGSLTSRFVGLGEAGRLDQVLTHSDEGIPLQSSPMCGPTLVLRRGLARAQRSLVGPGFPRGMCCSTTLYPTASPPTALPRYIERTGSI
nr:HD domain-containing protein [uncultured Rhodoferax sp.]